MTKKSTILSKNNKLNLFLKILASTTTIVLTYFIVKSFVQNTSSINSIVSSANAFGPILLILLMILGIIFTPIPYFLLIITAGYLYGIWPGALYSYLGQVLAAIGVFTFTKFINIKIRNKTYKKYQGKVNRNKKILYLMYILPVIPISVTSIISASSKIKWKSFLKIVLISFVPGTLFFTFFGNTLSTKNIIIVTSFLLITLIALIFFMKKFKLRLISKKILRKIFHKRKLKKIHNS